MSNQRLCELAVEGLFQKNSVLTAFNELPPEIRELVIPSIIKKLSTLDSYKSKIERLELSNQKLQEENYQLEAELLFLRNKVNNIPKRPPIFPPYSPDSPDIPEPFISKNKIKKESKIFTFDNSFC